MEKRIKVKYLKVRMEDALYAALSLQAKIGHRSKNAQAEEYIEQGVKRDRRGEEVPLPKAGGVPAPRRKRA